jgi:hypothetical protein
MCLRLDESAVDEGPGRYLADGGGAGAPTALNVSPFGRTTRRIRPTGAPLLTGCNVTVTASPALNEVRAQPRRLMSVGF